MEFFSLQVSTNLETKQHVYFNYSEIKADDKVTKSECIYGIFNKICHKTKTYMNIRFDCLFVEWHSATKFS